MFIYLFNDLFYLFILETYMFRQEVLKDFLFNLNTTIFSHSFFVYITQNCFKIFYNKFKI